MPSSQLRNAEAGLRPMTLVKSRVQSWPNAELARSRPNMGRARTG
jgi:hypothetical protein